MSLIVVIEDWRGRPRRVNLTGARRLLAEPLRLGQKEILQIYYQPRARRLVVEELDRADDGRGLAVGRQYRELYGRELAEVAQMTGSGELAELAPRLKEVET